MLWHQATACIAIYQGRMAEGLGCYCAAEVIVQAACGQPCPPLHIPARPPPPRYDLSIPKVADRLEAAVNACLDAGLRTGDIYKWVPAGVGNREQKR